MIIWIASYPKSGNTWVRSVLVSYYFSGDGKFNFDDLSRILDYPSRAFLDKKININNLKDGDIHQYWDVSQKNILNKGKAKFLKTHNLLGSVKGVPFTKPEYTLGVIHIIRDPRNVITSIKNHLNFENYEKAFEYMKSEDTFIKGEDSARFSFLGSWRSHYTSWMSAQYLKRVTIKYEDMEENPHETFKKIISFVNMVCNFNQKINEEKLKNSIETTSFEKLRKGEIEGKFSENVVGPNNKKIQFFFMGPKNNWKKLLPSSIKDNINNYFKKDLSILKYEVK